MTKGELNIAVAELQQKVNRIEATRSKAIDTACRAVDRKYTKHVLDLLQSKLLQSANGQSWEEPQYTKEVIDRVELPGFCTYPVSEEDIEDLGEESPFDPSKLKSITVTDAID